MARAKKKVVNGIRFDSITEADYYALLLEKSLANEISDLKRQVTYKLFDTFKLRKRTIRAMVYTPDFEYTKDGVKHVVEVKGYAKADYMMRRKIFLWIYGETCVFEEVKRKGKKWVKSVW